jgi:hypothetical protein
MGVLVWLLPQRAIARHGGLGNSENQRISPMSFLRQAGKDELRVKFTAAHVIELH